MIIIEWLWRQIVIAKFLSSKKFSSSRLSPRFLYPLIFIRGNGVFLNGWETRLPIKSMLRKEGTLLSRARGQSFFSR